MNLARIALADQESMFYILVRRTERVLATTTDPATARRALSASWENFETSLMMNVVPVLVPALNTLSKGLNVLGNWAPEHPDITKGLVIGFAALSGALPRHRPGTSHSGPDLRPIDHRSALDLADDGQYSAAVSGPSVGH